VALTIWDVTNETHARRRALLRAKLAHSGFDALLVTDLINIRYLTGFTGSNAALLVLASDDESGEPETIIETDAPSGDPRTLFCTDGRYTTQSADEVPDLPRLISRPCDLALLRRAPEGVIGFEAMSVTVAAHHGMTATTVENPAAIDLTPTTDVVEGLRAVKDDGEVESLRRACAVADQALAELIDAGGVRPGRSERQVGLDLDQRMRELGASDPSFETIVAAGPNSAIPHHRPTDAVLGAGDFVKFDFGATVDGYHSDMTRTFVLGAAADWQQEIFSLVERAQAAGRAACVAGATGDAIDAASRDLIADAGFGPQFSHGLGHGVGLQIHEAPSLARGSASIMVPDMCVTVEPGVYLPGRGGVRIEDSGVIRADGYDVLTMTSKDLIVLA
jgi:Xaa-Pro aminopeptidase